MPYYKFGKNDLFTNVVATYPEVSLYIYGSRVYYKNQDQSLVNSNTPSGHINLYDLNVNRTSDNLIYPFMPKDANLTTFKTITTSSFSAADYGTIITGSYPLTASISTYIYTNVDLTRKYVNALKNRLNNKVVLSPHYAYECASGVVGLNGWNKATQQIALVDIPSIFYGSKIKKGTVKLEFFISGSSMAQLVDKNRDGVLFQVSGTTPEAITYDNNVAGQVLYEEGILLLTGSWSLNLSHSAKYIHDASSSVNPKWNAFGRLTNQTPSSSYAINFSGSQEINAITMMCRAPAGQLNLSQNPTYVEKRKANSCYTCYEYTATPTQFAEVLNRKIKNTVSSSYGCHEEGFQRQTFITKIGIYDKNKNLIAIASIARPVKKTEDRDLTFKLKVDI